MTATPPPKNTVDLGVAIEMRDAGAKALDVGEAFLVACGFREVERGVPFRDLGVQVDFRARDAGGRAWLFELSGGFSATRPGLRKPEVLWRELGKAAVLHESRRSGGREDLGPLVLVTTDLPLPGSPPGRALRTASGGDRPVHDVVVLLSPEGAERLIAIARGKAASKKASGRGRRA